MLWAQGLGTTGVMSLLFAPDFLPAPPRPTHYSAKKMRRLSCEIRAETLKKMNSPNGRHPEGIPELLDLRGPVSL